MRLIRLIGECAEEAQIKNAFLGRARFIDFLRGFKYNEGH